MAYCRYRVLHQRPDRCQQRAGVLCHIGYTGCSASYPGPRAHRTRLPPCREPPAHQPPHVPLTPPLTPVPHPGDGEVNERGVLLIRAGFDKSHNHLGSSARRLVIGAVYPL